MSSITLMEVKQALRDRRFREILPENFAEDVRKYLNNPGCACNVPIYRRLLKEAGEQLKAYYPGRELSNIEEEVKKLAENHFSVIDCHKDELEDRLRKLPSGRKQLAICRWEDQCTVIVNELEQIW